MSISRIGTALVAIIAAVAAVFAIFRAIDDRSAPPIVIEDAAAILPIAVDLRGAVATPGVYELPSGARLQDAIEAGGGLTSDADLASLNLARRLRDGEVVVVAGLTENPDAAAAPPSPADAGSDAAVRPRIDINTATVEELTLLPRIGEVTAQRIVAFREEHGPYRSVDDLVHVQGISPGIVDELRPLVTTGP